MTARTLFAYVLLGFGGLALLARVGPDTGWLWVALGAVGFLAAYRKERTYAFLVIGGVLAGVAVGLLLEGAWRWPGAFLIALGAGFMLIDRLEPRRSRWPIYPAAVLIGLGLLVWLFRAGVLQSLWFPLLMIVAGIYLLRRPRTDNWVEVDEPSRQPQSATSDPAATPDTPLDYEPEEPLPGPDKDGAE